MRQFQEIIVLQNTPRDKQEEMRSLEAHKCLKQ